ncbi:MAG: hypothetical protein KUG68_09470 [Flavobacteriaceae bacterium]|nr:hypothetical protein [Flavobacteriaceae bacterium]
MRVKFFILCFFITVKGITQQAVGEILTKDGTNIIMYENKKDVTQYKYDHIITGDMGLTGASVHYYNAQEEFVNIKQNEVEEMRFGEHLYKSYPISGNSRDRLQKVILENEDYVLTSYFFLVNYYYIFRKSDNKSVNGKTKHSKKRKMDYKSLEKTLPKYFPECKSVFEQIRKNIKGSDYKIVYGNVAYADNKMFKGIQKVKCN